MVRLLWELSLTTCVGGGRARGARPARLLYVGDLSKSSISGAEGSIMSTATFKGILPTELEGHRGKEIQPGVRLITNPKYIQEKGHWAALANVGGYLCVVQLRVFIR